MIKVIIFSYMFWFVLTIIFITGTTRWVGPCLCQMRNGSLNIMGFFFSVPFEQNSHVLLFQDQYLLYGLPGCLFLLPVGGRRLAAKTGQIHPALLGLFDWLQRVCHHHEEHFVSKCLFCQIYIRLLRTNSLKQSSHLATALMPFLQSNLID